MKKIIASIIGGMVVAGVGLSIWIAKNKAPVVFTETQTNEIIPSEPVVITPAPPAPSLNPAPASPLGEILISLDSDGDTLYDLEELRLGRNSQKRDYLRSGSDQDRDGLPDVTEAWFGTDPKKSDTDGNGISDVFEFENIELGLTHTEDNDNDGLTDYAETKWYGTDPNNPDTDGDGFKDGAEVLNGYKPKGDGKL